MEKRVNLKDLEKDYNIIKTDQYFLLSGNDFNTADLFIAIKEELEETALNDLISEFGLKDQNITSFDEVVELAEEGKLEGYDSYDLEYIIEGMKEDAYSAVDYSDYDYFLIDKALSEELSRSDKNILFNKHGVYILMTKSLYDKGFNRYNKVYMMV